MGSAAGQETSLPIFSIPSLRGIRLASLALQHPPAPTTRPRVPPELPSAPWDVSDPPWESKGWDRDGLHLQMSERSLWFCSNTPQGDELSALGPPQPPWAQQELQILPTARRCQLGDGRLGAPMRETAIEMLKIINVCNSCQKAPAQAGRAGEGGSRAPSSRFLQQDFSAPVAVAHCISFTS